MYCASARVLARVLASIAAAHGCCSWRCAVRTTTNRVCVTPFLRPCAGGNRKRNSAKGRPRAIFLFPHLRSLRPGPLSLLAAPAHIPSKGLPYGRLSPGTWASRERMALLLYIYILFFTRRLSSFRTSRGHRCRPFSPPVLAFNFYRA